MGELRTLLEKVSDSYDDFVEGMMVYLKDDPENREKVTEYIQSNPDAKTDDILEYMDELWGI